MRAPQRRHRPPADRVAPPRRQRGQRPEHERPLAEARMRHGEAGVVDHGVAVEHQVEIERARRPQARPRAAALRSSASSASSSSAGAEPAAAHGHGVQVVGLQIGHVERRRLFEGRHAAGRRAACASCPTAHDRCAARSPRLLPSATATRTARGGRPPAGIALLHPAAVEHGAGAHGAGRAARRSRRCGPRRPARRGGGAPASRPGSPAASCGGAHA